MMLKCKRSVFFLLLIAGLLLVSGCSGSSDDEPLAQANDTGGDDSGNGGNGGGGNPPAVEIIDYDMVIVGGEVIDPETGRDEYAAVGIKDGVIRTIKGGDNADLPCTGDCKKIDATGLVVSPGFINTHTHEGNNIGANNFIESSKAFVQDGITFWLGGNCGLSATGVELKFGDIVINNKIGLTIPEYLGLVEQGGIYNNYGTMTGNITLRGDVGLKHQEEESGAQIIEMVKMLDEQMALGTFGVSFGPFYDPGTTKEAMIALAKESKKLGGMSAIHMRMPTFNTWNVLNPWAPVEGSTKTPNVILFGNSVSEAIDVCKESKAPMLVSHITDVSLNGSLAWVLDKIEKAYNEDGLPIAGDIIGYDTFSNDLLALTQFGTIPPGVLMTLGRIKPEQLWPAEDVLFADGSGVKMPAYQKLKSVEEAQELVDGFLNKTLKKPDDSESISLTVWCNIVDPALTKLALKKPFVFMGNDGGVSKNRKSGKLDVQPRTYACFSRLIGHWSNSNDQDAISLKQALFKATIAPAMWLGLSKKGRLQEGCDADIVIFDKNTIKDRASAENVESLNLPPVGFSKVIVNGTVVVDNGELTGEAPGKLIRRTWKIEGNTKNVVEMYNKRFPSDS